MRCVIWTWTVVCFSGLAPAVGESFRARLPAPPPAPRVDAEGNLSFAVSAMGLGAAEKDDRGLANLARGLNARPAASSCLPGYAIHQVAHLNDGRLGNAHSWISAGEPSWAEIDLGDVYWIDRVAFGSDSAQQYRDRAAATFTLLASTRYEAESGAGTWTTVYRQDGGPAVHTRREFRFEPVRARWLRVDVTASRGGNVRIDELEVFGQKEPIPPEKTVSATTSREDASAARRRLLREVFLAEEHAWLKACGRADLDSGLVNTPYREKRYPRFVGHDRLPVAPLPARPVLDGELDESCWQSASRGTVRVAALGDFEAGPLAELNVAGGVHGEDLYLALHADRLLSSHLAAVSLPDGRACGVLALSQDGLVFRSYEAQGRRGSKLAGTRPVDGAFDPSLRCVEARLPLAWFEGCREAGLRVGLGLGGRHTAPEGRPVQFVFAPWTAAQVGTCEGGRLRVRLAVPESGKAVTLSCSAADLAGATGSLPARAAGREDGTGGQAAGGVQTIALSPGESRLVSFPAQDGPIGPQLNLRINDGTGDYALHLFAYDPLHRTLGLFEGMLERLAARGVDVTAERGQLADFRRRRSAAAGRELLFEARLAKRRLMLRDPELEPLQDILFVKRHAFEPSHNYSVILDSRWRPGGGIYAMHIPRRDGRLEPEEATLRCLFDAAGGIARNPMADFDLSKVYFGYRPAEDDYYHIMSVDPDGSGLEQLTSGPFHDYWPCPLPDGGLAFISTRCRARFLCWRPQAAVLFRMEADGSDIRPLSFANLTEWGPSVMSDGRIIWQRSEYIDKGADYSHTLWAIRPDGSKPELVFGNTVLLPQGYANGREVPGTREICCTLISHFGDLNGPIALVDLDKGRFTPEAITSITPEVPWPGYWPREECFRDPVPISRDYVLCSHAPGRQFGLCVIDRHGNREMLHLDESIGSMCPTPFRAVEPPPVLAPAAELDEAAEEEQPWGEFFLADVYRGLEPAVERGEVRYLRVVEELRAELIQMPDGSYQKDHTPFMHWYAAPVDKVRGPYGWPSYVAKADWGIAPVEKDGSARFLAPAGRQLYFQVLDENFNELQRMRSVVQVQPGERRSCIGCHENRREAPPDRAPLALGREASTLQAPPWGAGPVAYERVVQPVLNARCVRCHDSGGKGKIDLSGTRDADRIPASYKTLIQQGWVHHFDLGYKSGENGKAPPKSFGTLQSRLFQEVLAGEHEGLRLSDEQVRAIKVWIDMNCPLWADYKLRQTRPLECGG